MKPSQKEVWALQAEIDDLEEDLIIAKNYKEWDKARTLERKIQDLQSKKFHIELVLNNEAFAEAESVL